MWGDDQGENDGVNIDDSGDYIDVAVNAGDGDDATSTLSNPPIFPCRESVPRGVPDFSPSLPLGMILIKIYHDIMISMKIEIKIPLPGEKSSAGAAGWFWIAKRHGLEQ